MSRYDELSELWLKNKDKLVAGSVWVCDVECYAQGYRGGGVVTLREKFSYEMLSWGENEILFRGMFGLKREFVMPVKQFLVCFKPLEKGDQKRNNYQEENVVIKTSLANAYGEVFFIKEGDSYYMALDNYSGGSKARISKAMFDEAEKIDWSEETLDWSEDDE